MAFAGGLGKGSIGFVLKPLSGTFDVLSYSTEGIRNHVSNYYRKQRKRHKRVLYGQYSLIRP